MSLNWFGMKPHPTDDLIWWGEKDPQKVAAALREDYDLLCQADPEWARGAIGRLLEAQAVATRADAAETAAGEDL